MRYYISIFVVLVAVFLSSNSYSQSVVLKYAKGGSLLFFDLPTKSKLYNVYGLSIQKNHHTFGVNHSRSSLMYDEDITSGQQLFQNFSNDINTYGFSYAYEFGGIEKLKLDIGFTIGYSDFSSYTNITNAYGASYETTNFDQWESLGYFSDSDFETPFYDINPDDISEYPKDYFSFGPSLTSSYEVVKNVSIYLTAIYRKNLTDLLDNTSINNTRDISANSNDDNQLDFHVGVSFNLSANKKMDNDSLMSYIESITGEDESEKNIDDNQISIDDTQEDNLSKNTELISREEYILDFFNLDEEEINTASLQENSEEEDAKTDEIFNSEYISDTLSRKEYILKYFDIPSEENESIRSEKNNLDNTDWREESQDDLIVKDDSDSFKDSTPQTCYLIVGVFSQLSNLESMASSLQIDIDNYFVKNDLYYLYIFKTDLVSEAKQLRNSLDVESWIYYTN